MTLCNIHVNGSWSSKEELPMGRNMKDLVSFTVLSPVSSTMPGMYFKVNEFINEQIR